MMKESTPVAVALVVGGLLGSPGIARAQGAFDGTLDSYVRYALSRSPQLEAARARATEAQLSVSKTKRIPEPTVSYGYFVRNVETRVGPQQHRIGVSQSFPWPTKLTAAARAATQVAEAAEQGTREKELRVTRLVAEAYWKLWLIDEEHRLMKEHDLVLETLAGTVRGRVQTGAASLADLSQVELGVARHHDHHGAHREAQRSAQARLLAVSGAAHREPTPVTDQPRLGLPAADEQELHRIARSSPGVERLGLMASASEHRAAMAAADKLGGFRVGVDYIVTGEAEMSGVADSGKDPIIASVALSLPLWWGIYDANVEAARAEERARRAEQEQARLMVDAELQAALSAVRDGERRTRLYRDTLIPQGETTYRSVLGSYQTGRSTVAAVLLAQRELLELQLDLAQARANHARSWAWLEEVVGATVPMKEEGEG